MTEDCDGWLLNRCEKSLSLTTFTTVTFFTRSHCSNQLNCKPYTLLSPQLTPEHVCNCCNLQQSRQNNKSETIYVLILNLKRVYFQYTAVINAALHYGATTPCPWPTITRKQNNNVGLTFRGGYRPRGVTNRAILRLRSRSMGWKCENSFWHIFWAGSSRRHIGTMLCILCCRETEWRAA